jgi:Arc/MetJ-type ribon-helix-helix transcriptional regulator
MAKFDLSSPAELFPSRNRKIANKVKYRRFDHASDAIRFAVEELPEALLLGAYIEINEERLGHKDIRALYESENFPTKAVA